MTVLACCAAGAALGVAVGIGLTYVALMYGPDDLAWF